MRFVAVDTLGELFLSYAASIFPDLSPRTFSLAEPIMHAPISRLSRPTLHMSSTLLSWKPSDSPATSANRSATGASTLCTLPPVLRCPAKERLAIAVGKHPGYDEFPPREVKLSLSNSFKQPFRFPYVTVSDATPWGFRRAVGVADHEESLPNTYISGQRIISLCPTCSNFGYISGRFVEGGCRGVGTKRGRNWRSRLQRP